MIIPEQITESVISLCQKASFSLPPDVQTALKKAFSGEKNEAAQDLFEMFNKNLKIAKRKQVPLCQDTGTAIVFVEKGDKVHLSGIEIENAIHLGVKKGYNKYYLRKSIVSDPLRRINTGNNLPAVIHMIPKKGSKLKITLLTKGGGAENCSQIKMLKPSEGESGCIDFIVDVVKQAGSRGCPPYTVGVGIGGNFEGAPYMAKKALIRPLTKSHKDPFYAKMEKDALKRINQLGIGPQGFGGKVTAIAVNIETGPCHIASLPIAVNLECWMHRHSTVTIND